MKTYTQKNAEKRHMLNDVQALFLLIYSVTYVTTLANWPVDSFATAAMAERSEYSNDEKDWVSVEHFWTKARLRFIASTVFGSLIPILYLGFGLEVLSASSDLDFSNWPVTITKVLLVGLSSLLPHASHRVYFAVLMKWKSRLVDWTERFTEYFCDRKGGSQTLPKHHAIGSLVQLVLSLISLALLFVIG